MCCCSAGLLAVCRLVRILAQVLAVPGLLTTTIVIIIVVVVVVVSLVSNRDLRRVCSQAGRQAGNSQSCTETDHVELCRCWLADASRIPLPPPFPLHTHLDVGVPKPGVDEAEGQHTAV